MPSPGISEYLAVKGFLANQICVASSLSSYIVSEFMGEVSIVHFALGFGLHDQNS